MKTKKKSGMLLLGALLALANCTEPAGVDTVSGLRPANGSSTTDTTPTFSWNTVAGAAKYQIQIAGSEAEVEGISPVEESGTSYTPTVALTNKQSHYWRVRAVDGGEQAGNWSTVYSLRVEIGAVSGLHPADGSSTKETKPEFRWNAVAGAAKYQIQIADSAEDLAGNTTVNKVVSGNIYYTPATDLTVHQRHYWRVRAVDGEEQAGDWSDINLLKIGIFVGDTGPAGGIVFYDKGTNSGGWRFLEAAPYDQGSYQWGGRGTLIGDTGTGIGSGEANTDEIVKTLMKDEGSDYAAKICSEFELGDHDDWFLPSKDELAKLFKQKNVVGGFSSSSIYWSSSDYTSFTAWGQRFDDGGAQGEGDRGNKYRVRAVRAF